MIRRLFLDHPRQVGEGYFEHLVFATCFSARLLKAAGAAFLHALVPALCESTASRTISEMHAQMELRRKAMGQSAAKTLTAAAAMRAYHGRGAAGS